MGRLARALRRRRGDAESGAVMVEFVLILPLLLLMAMAILEFGWWIHVNNTVDQAARSGARRAAIDGAISPQVAQASERIIDGSRLQEDRTTISTAVNGSPAGSISAAAPVASIGYRCVMAGLSNTAAEQQVGVTVSYDYRPLFPVLSSPIFFGGLGNLGDVSATATLPAETMWVTGTGPQLPGGQLRC